MGKYDSYLVCENGHGVNPSYYRSPEFNQKYCTTCGAVTRKDCPNCGKDIEGRYRSEGVIMLGSRKSVPQICKHCGKDFPWK